MIKTTENRNDGFRIIKSPPMKSANVNIRTYSTKLSHEEWDMQLKEHGVYEKSDDELLDEQIESALVEKTDKYDTNLEVIKGLAFLGTIFFVLGTSKSSKSFYVFNLALALSKGINYLGMIIPKAWSVLLLMQL